MQLIKCTKKLQNEMELKKSDISEAEPDDVVLGSWHANLIYIDGKKCVVFVNDKTLFNFIVPDVSRALIKDLSNLFTLNLESVLSNEGISEKLKKRIISEYESIEYTNTSSKSVLGSLNDLAFHYKHHIQSVSGVHSPAIPAIIKNLNHMPMGALEFVFPSEALKVACEKAT